jgi:hypothetical protein
MFTTVEQLKKHEGKPIVFVLQTGLEIIGVLDEVFTHKSQDGFQVSKVRQVRIVPHPQNPQQATVNMDMPLSMLQPDEVHNFLITAASLIYSPTNEMEKSYLQATSGIALA